MFTERRLGAWFEKIRLEWRGLGKTKYLPFIVNYIVLPLFVVVCANASYMNKEDYYFAENGSYFIPFMSVWWMILILQEYVEGIGSEVIRIYDKNISINYMTIILKLLGLTIKSIRKKHVLSLLNKELENLYVKDSLTHLKVVGFRLWQTKGFNL